MNILSDVMLYNVCMCVAHPGASDVDSDAIDEDRMVSSAVEALEKLFSDTLSKGLQDVLGTAGAEQAQQEGGDGNLSALHIFSYK